MKKTNKQLLSLLYKQKEESKKYYKKQLKIYMGKKGLEDAYCDVCWERDQVYEEMNMYRQLYERIKYEKRNATHIQHDTKSTNTKKSIQQKPRPQNYV